MPATIPADLVLVGGRVWTDRTCALGDGMPTAVAVTDGRIQAVGGDSEVFPYIGSHTNVVDVEGRRIVPGLVDSHLHAVRAGWSYLAELDWTQTGSVAAALDSITVAARERAPGRWITALGGWHPTQFSERRGPSRTELDAAAPRHPVFVHPVYGFADHGVLNTVALQALGWTGQCQDPSGGTLYRLSDGTPDGRLTGVSAFQAVVAEALQPTTEESEASTRAFFGRLAGLGLTGVIDAGGLGMVPEKYGAVRALWRRGELPLRVRMFVGAVTAGREAEELANWQRYLTPALGDDMLSVLGLGEALHYGCHDWEGMAPFAVSQQSRDELAETLLRSARGGWPLTIHAILDSSVTVVLDAIESVVRQVPIEGLRWSLCHAECASMRNLERMRALGLGLTVQSRISHKGAVCAERWSEDVFRHAPPLGDIAELGIPFGAGTDGTRAASYNPWRALWWFVTGRCQDGGPRRDARHRLDRATALDAYTRGSTWFSFEDHRRGRLLAGADADLSVLSADYFTVDEDEIPSITSELTIVAGRVVHAGHAFADLPIELHPSRPAPGTAAVTG
ncbi:MULTISPECIES: amidohydrolase [unclassified Mycobacterium]|uniref:amidohydrolase n=1 Tax=unclassified Mycobacterium TaxID=2642494 RepID=UPI0029C7B900|nr:MULTISPECIES: amidohydrolase [unclassified Mycobacterium]